MRLSDQARLSEPAVSEEAVVHELMHLQMKLEGYLHGIHWHYACPEDAPVQTWLSNNVKDTVEHWIFYPREKALGDLKPDLFTATDIRNLIRNDYAGDLPSMRQASFFYFRALALPNQAELSNDLARLYRSKGLDHAIAVGSQMYTLLLNEHPSTPEQEIRVFVACANILFDQSRTFRAKESTFELLGTLKVRWVDIAMMPTSSCSR